MDSTQKLIDGLNATIAELKSYRQMTIRGYEQAMEEVGAAGDANGEDWSGAYNYLKGRVAHFKSQG